MDKVENENLEASKVDKVDKDLEKDTKLEADEAKKLDADVNDDEFEQEETNENDLVNEQEIEQNQEIKITELSKRQNLVETRIEKLEQMLSELQGNNFLDPNNLTDDLDDAFDKLSA